MKIKLTRVHVSDQEKALRFYTDVLGFVKKADFTQGPFRWLTVASPEEPCLPTGTFVRYRVTHSLVVPRSAAAPTPAPHSECDK